MYKTIITFALWTVFWSTAYAQEDVRAQGETKRREVIEKLEAAGFPFQGVLVDATGACILDLTESSVSNLSPVRGLPIDIICLRWSKKINDLSPLAGMKLTGLDLRDTPVTDLSPLATMPLEKLVIAGTKVKNIQVLESMPLTFLDASGTEIEDLGPLKKSPLKTLILNRTHVADLSPLQNLPLYSLHISGTPVTDLRPLKNSKLGELFFEPEKITLGINLIRDLEAIHFLGGGKLSDHFIDAREFWDRFDHGHPVDNWIAEARAGMGQYAPEPEILEIEPQREKRARELLRQLGDDSFLVRQEAEALLSAESRTIIPWLEQFEDTNDLEVRYRVRRLVRNLTANSSNAPSFAFSFQKQVRMTPEQWREALEAWRAETETVVSNDSARRLGVNAGSFAQSFVATSTRIAGVELMVHPASKGRGWIKVELCEDEGGTPSTIVLSRAWVRMEGTSLPPHDVYLPIDLPDTTVRPNRAYWLTCSEITDQDSPTPLTIYYGWTAGNEYSKGRMLLPKGHVKVERDAHFRILSTCPPVPLLRKASEDQIQTLPDLEDTRVTWNIPSEGR